MTAAVTRSQRWEEQTLKSRLNNLTEECLQQQRRRMGGNSPSHFSEEEEGGGITFVKGILLSDRVINRMKRSAEVNSPHIPPELQTAASSAVPVQPDEHLPPPPPPPPPQETRATPPPVEPAPPVKPIPPSPPVKFHSLPSASVESAEQNPPPESVPSHADVKSDVSPSATIFEPAAAAAAAAESAASSPPPAELVPSSPVDSAPAEALSELVLPSVAEEDPPAVDSGTPPPPSEVAAASDLDAAAPCWSEKLSVVPSDVAVNETNAEEPSITCLPPAEEETPAGAAGPPPAAALPSCPESVVEELRQKIKEELQRSLEEEMKQKRQKLQQQLEEVRVQAQAEAQAAAKAQVQQQVSRMLKAEPAEERAEAEKMKTEDVTLMVQLYWMELKAQQLEDKEKLMKERDVLYKEQAAKREAKFSEFCKVSAENFQRGKEETQRRFARFNTQPVCGRLQAQVLKCYKENPGKTLNCSGIASAYVQCVDNAKKVHIKT